MKKTYKIKVTNKTTKQGARYHNTKFTSKAKAEAWASKWNKMMPDFEHQVVEG